MLRGDLFKQADEWWSYVVDVIIVTLIAILFATIEISIKDDNRFDAGALYL